MPPKRTTRTTKAAAAAKVTPDITEQVSEPTPAVAEPVIEQEPTTTGDDVVVTDSIPPVVSNEAFSTEQSTTTDQGLNGATEEKEVEASETVSASTEPETQEENPEEAKKRARAAKFGIPYVPTPAPAPKPTPASKPAAPAVASAKDTTPSVGNKRKAGLEGEKSVKELGISEEVLAKRREKFGVVEPAQSAVKQKKEEEPVAVKEVDP